MNLLRDQVYPKSHTRRTVRVGLLRSTRTFIVELGLVADSELDGPLSEGLAYLDDPDVIVISSVNFVVLPTAGSAAGQSIP
jgi:hypothetical protein